MTLVSNHENTPISVEAIQAVVESMAAGERHTGLRNRGWRLVLDKGQTGPQVAALGGFSLSLEPLDPARFRHHLFGAVNAMETGAGNQNHPSVTQFVLAEAVDQRSVAVLLTQMLTSAQASPTDRPLLRASALGPDLFGMSAPETEAVPALEDYLSGDRLSHVDQGIFASGASHPERCETLARFVEHDGSQLPAARVLTGRESEAALAQLDCIMLVRSVSRMVADPALKLSINVCRTTLSEPPWLTLLDQLMATHEQAVQRAVFEITEWPARKGHSLLLDTLKPLSQRGLALWLDDFGAGLTSFNEALMPEIAALKIDRSLLRRCYADQDAFGVLALIAAFARRQGKLCVMEGVENLSERQFAETCGASHVQGFFSGRL